MVSLCAILVAIKPGLVAQSSELNPQRKILLRWLNNRDPDLFKRCKVFFDENLRFQDVPMKQEGNYSVITAILCGNEAKFWINNKARLVECCISYCGKNIGHKYCGKDITNKLCEQ